MSGTLATRVLCGQYDSYSRFYAVCTQSMTGYCGWYLGLQWIIMPGTLAMTEYHAWYISYDGGLLAVLFAQMDYVAGTKGHGGLQGWYSFYGQYKCEQGATALTKQSHVWSGIKFGLDFYIMGQN